MTEGIPGTSPMRIIMQRYCCIDSQQINAWWCEDHVGKRAWKIRLVNANNQTETNQTFYVSGTEFRSCRSQHPLNPIDPTGRAVTADDIGEVVNDLNPNLRNVVLEQIALWENSEIDFKE